MLNDKPQTILLVEDEAVTSIITSKILQKLGYNVISANSGEKAVETSLSNNDINLILMDIDLGEGIDGPEAAQQILARKHIPIVFLTSHSEQEMVEKVRGITRYGYVIKNSGEFVLRSSIEMAFELFDSNQKLQTEEKRYRTMFENTGTSMILIEEDMTISMANNEFVRNAEYTLEELIGKMKWPELVHPDDLGRMVEQHRLRRENYINALKSYEFRYKTKSGNLRYSLLTIELVPGTKKSIASIIDITERKNAENTLHENEEKYRLLHENAGIGIGYYKPDGTVISYNRLAASHMNGKPEDFTGKSIYDIFTKQDAEFYHDRIRKSVISGVPIVYEDTIPMPSGDKSFISTFNRINDSSNNILGIQVISQDITERKQMEDKLRASEERFRMIYENAPVLIDAFDENGHCVLWNNACEQTFGWRIDEINSAPEPLALFYPDPETRAKVIESVTTKPDSMFHEWHPQTKQGKSLTCMWANYILPDGIVMNIGYDITERKIAEDTLQESEERFREIIESSLDIHYRQHAITYEIDYMSPAINRVLGYTLEEVFTMSIEDQHKMFHPDDLSQLLGFLNDLIVADEKGDRRIERVFRMLHKSGEVRWMNGSYFLTRDMMGDPKFVVGVLKDITEEKQVEKLLINSENHFRRLAEDLPASISTFLPDGTLTYVNNGLAELTGMSPEALTGRSFLNWLPPEERELVESSLASLSPEQPVESHDQTHISSDGSPRTVQWTNRAFFDEFGQAVSFQAIGIDITDRKHAEKGLKDSEEKFRRIFESNMIGIAYWHADGRLTNANKAFCDIVGYTMEDVKEGRVPWRDMTPPELIGRDQAAIDEINATGFCRMYEKQFIHKDGHLVPVLIYGASLAGIPDEGLTFVIDITERKQMEEALKDSHDKMLKANKLSRIGVWDWERETDTVTWSEELFHIAGLDPKQQAPTYAEHPTIYTPESWEILKTAVERAINTGEEYQLDLELVSPDGSIRIVTAFGGVKYGRTGQVVGLYGIVQDNTDRKQIERALQESEEKYRLLIDNANEAIIVAQEGKLKFINHKTIDIMRGYTDEELLTKSFIEFIHPDDKLKVAENYRKRLNGEFVPNKYEFRIINKENNIYWVEINSSFIKWNGKPATLNFLTDITERKLTENVLKESEEKFHLAFSNANTGMCLVDLNGNLLQVNDKMTEIFGYSRSELERMTVNDIAVTEDADLSPQFISQAIQKTVDSAAFEKRYLHKKKHIIYCLVSSSLVRDANGQPLYFISQVQDITSLKQDEEKIKTLLKEKELILKEVHHRLKNNMNTVCGLLTLQAGNIKDHKAISVLEDAANRVRSMMVLYDKLYQSDNVQNISVKYYLPSLVDEIIANFSNSKSVKIEKKIDDFMLDAKRVQPLSIIINELITNIMKYAFTGRDNGLITISASMKDEIASFIIKDNGIGIPESVDFKDSTGFGLQLVWMLSQELHGTIKIKRENGTKFILEFDI
jgi:PAS domain S-box-containing protein